MNIDTISKDELKSLISNEQTQYKADPSVRMLFAPNHVTDHNYEDFLSTYSKICGNEYDSVVIIESYEGHLDKKLAMPSNKSFENRFGEIQVNDLLRNEFCDEEDDFFIADEGYSNKMSLYDQLPFLQSCVGTFDVLSLQIGDYDPAIVRELAFVLDELMLSRKALIIFCCDIPATEPGELQRLRDMVINQNDSGLLNYLNSSDKAVKGARAFMCGILVARSWDLEIELMDQTEERTNITGFAYMKQPVAAS